MSGLPGFLSRESLSLNMLPTVTKTDATPSSNLPQTFIYISKSSSSFLQTMNILVMGLN